MKYLIILLLLIFHKLSTAQPIHKFTYDLQNRISSIIFPDSSKIQYSYDASGNRVGKQIISGAKFLSSNISSPNCSDTPINIPFNVSGNFSSSNTFSAQLSDTNGSFQNPTIIGFLNSNTSGAIAVNLSTNVLTDTRYKIRIVASNPEIFSSDTGTDFVINHCVFNVHTKLFIEGYYSNNGSMIPVVDPIDFPNLCDTVDLQLHSPNPPYEVLYSNRQIVQINGTCVFDFSTSPEFGKYFLSIKHRNALETWSNAPFAISDTNDWIISENPNLIYNNDLKDLGDGHFALYSGDVNQDGIIDLNDFINIETGATFFLSGYLPEDLTGDWLIESSDFSLIENNLGKIISKP